MENSVFVLGDGSFYRCPNCKKKKSYLVYINMITGNYIHPCVGKCVCGFNYTPKEYLKHRRI